MGAEDYSPPPFSPSLYSWSLHNIRATSNVLILPLDDYEWQDYYIGLAIIPCILALFWFIWLFAIIVTSCCNCRTSTRRKHGYIAFICLCVLSLAAWIPVYVANARTDEDLHGIAQGLTKLSNYLKQLESTGNGTRARLDTLRADNTELGTVCVDVIDRNLPEVDLPPYPMQEIDDVITLADDLLEDKVAGLSNELNTFVISFTSVYEMVIEERSKWTIVITTIMLVATLILMSATIYVFTQTQPSVAPHSNSDGATSFFFGISRAACIAVFTIGLLILTLCWFICVVYQVISVVSSDICLPSPDVVLQRLLGQLSGSVMVNPDGCFPDTNGTRQFQQQFGVGRRLLERPLPRPTDVAFFACYYQTCLGENIIADTLQTANKLAQSLVPLLEGYEGAVTELKRRLNESTSITEDERVIAGCVETFVSFTVELSFIALVVAGLISLVQCQNINQIYVILIRDGICNGFITNSVLLWSSSLAALLFLMIALLLHRIFRLDHPKAEYTYFPKHDSRSMFPDEADSQSMFRAPDTSQGGVTSAGPAADSSNGSGQRRETRTPSGTLIQEGPPGNYKVVLS